MEKINNFAYIISNFILCENVYNEKLVNIQFISGDDTSQIM